MKLIFLSYQLLLAKVSCAITDYLVNNQSNYVFDSLFGIFDSCKAIIIKKQMMTKHKSSWSYFYIFYLIL